MIECDHVWRMYWLIISFIGVYHISHTTALEKTWPQLEVHYCTLIGHSFLWVSFSTVMHAISVEWSSLHFSFGRSTTRVHPLFKAWDCYHGWSCQSIRCVSYCSLMFVHNNSALCHSTGSVFITKKIHHLDRYKELVLTFLIVLGNSNEI